MELNGIVSALRKGYQLHAFLSGGGLRVVRIQTKGGKLKGYGEHPLAQDALTHANEDFLAGHRPYDEVYGEKYPHYLTGTTEASDDLDQWMLKGHTFDAWWENREIVFELSGMQHVYAPEDLCKQVEEGGKPKFWDNRGFRYILFQLAMGNGVGTSMKCLNPPTKGASHIFYDFTKTGRGKTLVEAMANAFAAPEVEIMKN